MAQKKKNDSTPATSQPETPIEVSESQAPPEITTNPARDEYVNLLQAYHNDNSLTYDRLHEKILEQYSRAMQSERQQLERKFPNNDFVSRISGQYYTKVVEQFSLAKEYDRQVIEQALKSKRSPDDVIDAISQGIYVRSLSESDNGDQKVAEYISDLRKSYSERLNSPETSQNREKSAESSKSEITPGSSDKVDTPEAIVTEKKSSQAEEYALSLVQLLDQRRLNVDRLRIDINGETVFKMFDGEIDKRQSHFTSEHAELIKKALNDPASFDGSLKITQGSQVLLHVKDGRVLIDSVGLTKQSVKAELKTSEPEVKTQPVKSPDSSSKELYELSSKNVKSVGLRAAQDIASHALKNGVEPEQVMQMLKEHNPSYQRLAKEAGEKSADKMFEDMIDTTRANLELEKMPTQQQSKEVQASKSLSRSK
jgi:hypothetical protein